MPPRVGAVAVGRSRSSKRRRSGRGCCVLRERRHGACADVGGDGEKQQGGGMSKRDDHRIPQEDAVSDKAIVRQPARVQPPKRLPVQPLREAGSKAPQHNVTMFALACLPITTFVVWRKLMGNVADDPQIGRMPQVEGARDDGRVIDLTQAGKGNYQREARRADRAHLVRGGSLCDQQQTAAALIVSALRCCACSARRSARVAASCIRCA